MAATYAADSWPARPCSGASTQPDGSHRVALRPAFRGRGLSVDVLHTLCEYGFAVRVGFTREGTLRLSAWVYGAYADEAILGLLANEWTPRR